MKVNVEVEMTPDEARAMMGMPDVKPMQAKMMAEMEARMKAAFDAGDPDAMMRAWSPFTGFSSAAQPFEQFQKFLWDSARTVVAGGKPAGQKSDKPSAAKAKS